MLAGTQGCPGGVTLMILVTQTYGCEAFPSTYLGFDRQQVFETLLCATLNCADLKTWVLPEPFLHRGNAHPVGFD